MKVVNVVVKSIASLVITLALVCLCSAAVTAQAGRRSVEKSEGTYTVPLPDNSAPDGNIKQDKQDKTIYQCVDESQTNGAASAATIDAEVFTGKDVTTKAQVLSKPLPAYTLEARRNGTSGTVVLRVLLSSSARVTSVKVLRPLPDGLTENAVRVACAIRFKPAMKDERAVAQYLTVEYGFMTNFPYGIRTRRPALPPRP